MSIENRSLQELEGKDGGSPDDAPNPMVARCFQLYRTPLDKLEPGDIRLLISQEIGLAHVMELALWLLSEDVMLETEHYPGDLLNAVLRVDKAFWSDHPTERAWFAQILRDYIREVRPVLDKFENWLQETATLGHAGGKT